MEVPVDSRILATFVRLVTAQRAFSADRVRIVATREGKIVLTRKVVYLQSGMESTSVRTFVVNGNTRPHDPCLRQLLINRSNRCRNFVHLVCRTGGCSFSLGLMDCDFSIKINALGNTGKRGG